LNVQHEVICCVVTISIDGSVADAFTSVPAALITRQIDERSSHNIVEQP
jgi:hypothetical protein